MKIPISFVFSLFVLYCSGLANSNSTEDGATWIMVYDDIFGRGKDNSNPMTSSQLMEATGYLHDAAENLGQIDKEHKEKVEFWYDLIHRTNTMDPENCNNEHLNTIAEIYRNQNIGANVNFQRLYHIFRERLVQFCISQFVDMPDKLASIVPVEVAQSLLDIDSEAYSRDLREVLRTAILHSGDYSLRGENPAGLLKDWESKPCEALRSKLEQPGMEKYVNFLDLMIETIDLAEFHAKPIVLWVKVVKKCRDLHSFLPSIAHDHRMQRMAEEMWDTDYNRLFAGRKVSSYIGTSPEIKGALETLYVGSSFATDEKRKEVVKIWHEALVNFEVQNCSVAFLEKVSKLYAEQNTKNNANFKLLYLDVRKNAIERCDEHYWDLHIKLAARVLDKKLSDFLDSDKPGSEITSASIYFDPFLAETLADRVLRMVENGETGVNVINAWKRGTCAGIRAFLNEPGMKPYSDFVDMSLFGKRELLHNCSQPNQLWARVVDACKHLDQWIPKIANDRFLAKNVRTNIRTLMMV